MVSGGYDGDANPPPLNEMESSNTGGGGGLEWKMVVTGADDYGGNGGSGVAVVRYQIASHCRNLQKQLVVLLVSIMEKPFIHLRLLVLLMLQAVLVKL